MLFMEQNFFQRTNVFFALLILHLALILTSNLWLLFKSSFLILCLYIPTLITVVVFVPLISLGSNS